MIEYLEIKNYKSIKDLKIELEPINILIGSNGVGKTNFISFFNLINNIINQKLQQYVIEENVDNLLYFGRKISEEMFGKIIFKGENDNNNAYLFKLAPKKTEENLYFSQEFSGFKVEKDNNTKGYYNHHGNSNESKIKDSDQYRDKYLKKYFNNLQIFHFHDTSSTSFLRRECDINDNLFLRKDGRNLPAFLYLIKSNHPFVFKRMLKVIQSVAPYISDFILEPKEIVGKEDRIELRWIDKGDNQSNFSAYQLSDGTLRFIALTTLLMQPAPPSTIIIDEPELGLHPFAITKLSAMINMVSEKSQVIIATQSPGLINHFEPENIITIDKDLEENKTKFNRLNSEKLKIWLENYSLGDLWVNNNINSGQPFI